MKTNREFNDYLEDKTISELDKKIKDVAISEFNICPIDQEFYSFEVGIKYALENYEELSRLGTEKRNQFTDIKFSHFERCNDTPKATLYFRDEKGNWYDENLNHIPNTVTTSE